MVDSTGRTSRILRGAGLAGLGAATIAGLWALGVRFRDGLVVTDLTQHVPWGFWIALYIYFIGLSAGSFLLSTLVYVFGMRRLEAVGPLALLQAFVSLVLGLFLIWVDLGHPARFANVFLSWNPRSVLAWESVAYVLYAGILLSELLLVLQPALAAGESGGAWRRLRQRLLAPASWRAESGRWLRILGVIGIPVAVFVHGGTGAIFAVVKSRPTWYTGLFPIVFLVSALASGSGLLTFLTACVSRSWPAEERLGVVGRLAHLTVGLLAIDLLLLASEVLVVLYGGIPAHAAGHRAMLFGPFGWVFWVVQLGVGALAPIAIVAVRRARRSVGWLGAAGLLVVIGVLAVRLNIVIPAQIPPEFPALPDAYHHVRFERGYFPSANEWLVGLGTVALGVWAFLLARRALPFDLAERASLARRAPEEGGAIGGTHP